MHLFRRYFLSIYILLLICLINCTSCKSEPEVDLSERYVITSPELAEIVVALQGTENIVGVSTECDFPEELKGISKVGTFGSIDIEKVLTLRPTMVFVAGLEQDDIANQIQKVGIPLVSIYPGSISDIFLAIEEIATILNTKLKADSLISDLKKTVNLFRESSGKLKPKVYVEIYGNPIMSVSDSSYVGELVELVGGDNIFSKLPRAYSRIKVEEVIELDPDIILLTYPGVTAEDIKNRMGWEVISACRNNRIYDVNDVDPDLILRAGPRLNLALTALKEIL